MRFRAAPLLLLLFLVAQPGLPHGGGLDGYGCHHDRTRGGYHCHRGALAGRYFYSQSAMLEELRTIRGEAKPKEYDKAPPEKGNPFLDLLRENKASATGSELSEVDLVDLALTAQNLLMALGFNPGPINGEVNATTQSAVRRFQKEMQLPQDGRLTGKLLRRLAVEVRKRGVR